jgi:HPt (histidine-containing phosphotransfer) domain-containing protein
MADDVRDDNFDVSDLLPQYFGLCRRDLEDLRIACHGGDFVRARRLGHNLKGSGGAYGFPEITQIGADIETAAKANDPTGIREGTEKLSTFLETHASDV